MSTTASTTSTAPNAGAAPTTGAELSLTQLHLMRAGYLLMVVGLALKKWPLLPDAHTMPLYEGVTLCILVAMSLLAFLGLRYPVKLLPRAALRVGLEAPVARPGRAAQGHRRKPGQGHERHRVQLLLRRPHPRGHPVGLRVAHLRARERRPVAMSTPTPHTDVDLRLPEQGTDEDPANAATRQSAEAAGNPLDAISWPVRTDRLTLRPATRDDLEATWRFRRLDDVSRWLTRAPATLEEYRTSFEDTASLAKTLIIELDGQVIGDLMLAVEDAWAQAEVADQARGVHADLGWVLHPDHAGHGYATEAVRELLRLMLRRARAAPRHGELLRRQHRLMAADGTSRDAPRDLRRH